MKKILLILALFFAMNASAQGPDGDLPSPGCLPGRSCYLFERAGEWIDLNLFTVSTRAKEEKRAELASERLAEALALYKNDDKAAKIAKDRFEYFLRSAEDMAEKVTVLDGAEVPLVEKIEDQTFTYQRILLKNRTEFKTSGELFELLAIIRDVNHQSYAFFVTNYQFNQDDIHKFGRALDKHFAMVEELQSAEGEGERTAGLINDAKKHQGAGLNLRAYEILDQAEDLLLARLAVTNLR